MEIFTLSHIRANNNTVNKSVKKSIKKVATNRTFLSGDKLIHVNLSNKNKKVGNALFISIYPIFNIDQYNMIDKRFDLINSKTRNIKNISGTWLALQLINEKVCHKCVFKSNIIKKDDNTYIEKRQSTCYTDTSYDNRRGKLNSLKVAQRRYLNNEVENIEELPNYVNEVFSLYNGVILRFGAFGEPVHIPLDIVKKCISYTNGNYTGYSELWHDTKYREYFNFFVASIHNKPQIKIAKKLGIVNMFFVAEKESEKDDNMLMCPASKEGENLGFDYSCLTCPIKCNSNNTQGIRVINKH